MDSKMMAATSSGGGVSKFDSNQGAAKIYNGGLTLYTYNFYLILLLLLTTKSFYTPNCC